MIKFEDYGFGTKYQDAHLSQVNLPVETTEKILSWITKNSGNLIFCGNPGCGKTYLCAALLKRWLDEKKLVRYFTERNFFNKIRDAIQKNWDYEVEVKMYAEAPYFILDDIGSGQLTDWQKEITFSFLDHRINNALPTIITSNLWLEELKSNYGERFFSRLMDRENCVIELNWIDKRRE